MFSAGDGINYPKKGQTVTVHYTASYYLCGGGDDDDGTGTEKIFDSSRKRKKPLKFKLFSEQVIQGLDDGISQLSVGERAKITIPAVKAYGARGFPGLVPKNTDLVFDVELLSFS